MNPARADIRSLIFMLSGLLIWFAHLSVIYAFTAVACARGFAGVQLAGVGIVPLVIAGATLLAALALAAIAWSARRGRASNADREMSPFLRYTATALAALALVAVVWEALTVFFVLPCA